MELRGVGVGRGVVVATVLNMPDALPEPAAGVHGVDPALELAAFTDAVGAVAAQLDARAAVAGGPSRRLIEVAAQIARDPELDLQVRALITAGASAERAVFEAAVDFAHQFAAVGGVTAARAADVTDVAQRIIAELRGVQPPLVPFSETPFVLVARDLAPTDTAALDPVLVAGLVLREGGRTSHTAIIARARALPTVVGVGFEAELPDGTAVLLDAEAGAVIVDPSSAQIAEAERRRSRRRSTASEVPDVGMLADGTRIPLLANVDSAADAVAALELGAEGIGLFRTEFLFADVVDAPDVGVQFEHYAAVMRGFPGRPVVARVFDAGADKPLRFLNDGREGNPALGLRGLRALRVHESVLRDQLTALAEAQRDTGADLWVMAPMVADAEETEYFMRVGHEQGLRTVGVTAEIPSLAILADQVLELTDFVSIGTNDLTQFTMAADRELGVVSSYQDPWHPAVLRLAERLAVAAADAGKPVGICGEAASDPELAVVLVGLGAMTLSMAPVALAGVRAALAEVTLAQAKAQARAALASRTALEARAAARSVNLELRP
jgi:phosphotransferase system enzyme I (PtsI)